jgi:hypothetical protein
MQRLVAAAVLAAFAGCQQQPAGNAGGDGGPGELSAPAEAISAPAPAPDDPVSAVQATLGAVQQGRLEQAYDFLPSSYQRDIDQLVQTFAGKMDGELWTAAFDVLRKAVDVLRTKKDLVLQLIQQSQGPNATVEMEQLDDSWKGLVDSMELVVTSDISDLDRLKRLSLRQYLATTGNKFFAQMQALSTAAGGHNPLDELKKTKVELVSRDGGQAVLRITGPRDASGQEQPFVQIEGRWIPQSLADDWTENVQKAKDQLAQITPEQVAAQKSQALAQLKMVEDTLDGMLSAQKPEELMGAAFPLLFQLGSLQQAFTPAAPKGKVTILIERELTDDEESKLRDQLVQLTDNPERTEITSTTGGGRTQIILDKVADAEQFAEKLTFVASKTVDADTRTITIELKAD